MIKMRLEIKGKEAHIYEVPWKYSVKLADGEESAELITNFLNKSKVAGELGEYLETYMEECPGDEIYQFGWEGNPLIKEAWIHPVIPDSYEE